MRALLVLAFIAMLAGCRSEQNAAADNRILWDAEGCAYYVQPNLIDTSFVRPLPDASREGCKSGAVIREDGE